jgi:deoxyadenosine/deoxycytidine kinase
MATSLARLGEVVRAFRVQNNLSQEQLAAHARTNRSVVAHLEQGLRLPTPGRLSRICEYLGIPASLWEPFTALGLHRKLSRDAQVADIRRPRFIAVAGLIGSGKTTLARKLSRAFAYPYAPENVPARKYLRDLTQDPSRWAFETQLAFLTHKATQVATALRVYGSVVLDRSISEDINIFAQYFHQKGQIDDRAFTTYMSLGEYLQSTIPAPDLLIYCKCSLETSRSRIAQRARDDRDLHSPEYLSDIAAQYDAWIKSYEQTSIFEINSEEVDFKDDLVLHRICREIEDAWNSLDLETQQLDMFQVQNGEQPILTEGNSNLLQMISHRINIEATSPASPAILPSNFQAYPLAYIAAPFTALANTPPAADPQMSFEPEQHHGRIGKGKYRRFLLGLERTLKSYGFTTILPHRDVNGWGDIQLSPDAVMQLCTDHVKTCDLFVGLLGQSHGSHYELGVARGMGKPCAVIHCDELPESFISTGVVSNTDDMLVISCRRLEDIPRRLLADDVRDFLKRHLPIAEPNQTAKSVQGT